MRVRGAFSVAAVLAAGTALAAPATTGPVAVYWMSASTTSGFGGMGGAGGRPNMAAMMSMGRGGFAPNAAIKTLKLQLGSHDRPQGDPAAEHDPPDALGAGPMLPLLTPAPVATPAAQEEAPPAPPPQFSQPRGRLLIFWGCGEHASAGQPIVVDFATLAPDAAGRQMMSLMHAISVTTAQPPSPGRSTTYGEWPNAQAQMSVPPTGSLQGHHVVKGDYSPTIQFDLGANQDFLAPLVLTANQRNPSGSANLAWQAVDRSEAYFAGMFGSAGGGQVVMWTSSSVEAAPFGMPEYLPDGEARRLVASGVLMPPTQTACVISQEAMQVAGRSAFFTLTAFGGETNIAYPPRPPEPRPWNIAWTVKVRYRSATSGIVGVNLGGSHQAAQQQQGDQQQDDQPQKKASRAGAFFHALGSVAP